MLPVSYNDAQARQWNPKRSLLSLPNWDYDFYPELEADGALQRFGEMEGMYSIAFPFGFPYMDFQVADLSTNLSQSIRFPILDTNERFLLEAITLSWPHAGAGAFPETNPTGGEATIPTIQVYSSDPTIRHGDFFNGGPEMFWKAVPLNHVGGPGNLGSKGLALGGQRRLFPFGIRDTIIAEIKRTTTGPAWVGMGIQGRLVTEKFYQGLIR